MVSLKYLELPLVIQYSCHGGIPCGGLHSKTTDSPSVTTNGSVVTLGNLGTTVIKHKIKIAFKFSAKCKTGSLLKLLITIKNKLSNIMLDLLKGTCGKCKFPGTDPWKFYIQEFLEFYYSFHDYQLR